MNRKSFLRNLVGIGTGLAIVPEEKKEDHKDIKLRELEAELVQIKKNQITYAPAYSSASGFSFAVSRAMTDEELKARQNSSDNIIYANKREM